MNTVEKPSKGLRDLLTEEARQEFAAQLPNLLQGKRSDVLHRLRLALGRISRHRPISAEVDGSMTEIYRIIEQQEGDQQSESFSLDQQETIRTAILQLFLSEEDVEKPQEEEIVEYTETERMSPEEAFLSAIDEDFDDDTPRLIYADWLEEQGGQDQIDKATFIRAQIELARVGPGDAPKPVLQRCADRLQQKWQRKWIPEGFPGEDRWFVFRRGFLDDIHLSNRQFVQEAEFLSSQLPRIAKLYAQETDLHLLATAPHLERVHALDLWRSNVREALPALIRSPHAGNLRSLDLHCLYGDEFMRAFADSPIHDLQSFRSHGYGTFSIEGVRALAQSEKVKNMTKLDLGHVGVGTDGIRALLESPHLRKLTSLSLDCCGIDPEAVRTMLEIGIPESLVSLALRGRDLRMDGLRTLLHSPRLRQIRTLSLNDLWVEQGSEHLFAEAEHLQNLVNLHLHASSWQAPQLQVFGSSPHLQNLRHLNLSQTNFKNEGVSALAASTAFRNLISLDLSHCDMTADGVRALMRSENFPRLVHLNIRGCLDPSQLPFIDELIGMLQRGCMPSLRVMTGGEVITSRVQPVLDARGA